LIESAHDCAEGGLAVTLAEGCFDSPFGVVVDLAAVGEVPPDFRIAATLFGESASRVVVSVRPEHRARLQELARELGVPAAVIGVTGGAQITMKVDGTVAVDVAVREAETRWLTAIETLMKVGR
jgi:phosphoribosylformylglycinamidine synthase